MSLAYGVERVTGQAFLSILLKGRVRQDRVGPTVGRIRLGDVLCGGLDFGAGIAHCNWQPDGR